MLKQLSIAIIALSACLLPISVLAQINGVTTFGDSLSDNGNTFRTTGGLLPPSPPYFNGRFSNGPVWIENVISSFNLFNTSNNFAVGGATSGTGNTVSTAFPGLTTELDGFLQASPQVDPNRLFVVWAGANDYLGGGQTNPAVPVGNLATAIQRLTAAGATQIVVPNLPDLGKIPAGAADPAQSAGLTQLSAAHNSLLSASLRTLASNNPNISIVPTDLGALSNAIFANPARFGLTNVTQPCLNIATGAVCATPDTYFFWDPQHPTAAGHRIIGAFAFDTLAAPQTIAPQVTSVLSSTRRQTGDVNGRLLALRTTPASGERKLAAFVTGDLNTGDRQKTSTTTGFNIDTKGFTVGVDYSVTDRIVIGLAASNSSSNNQLNENKGQVGLNSSAVSIYGGYQQEKLYADALISYGWDSFDLTRRINVTGFDRATANPSGNRFSAGIGGGYDFGTNGLSIGPIVGIRYTKVNINGYTERNGDILNLKVNPQQADSLLFNIGAQVAYPFRTDFGTISPYISASYERELANSNRQIVTELVTQPGIPMRTNIGPDGPDFVRLSTGLQAQFANNLAVGVGYERLFGSNASENNLNAQLRYQF
ncbi:MAG: autotransporter domain-containing protein [Chamaesiphon sp.]|nr:autotransporter domain-containing protein [Chamaesiphon sp.]